MKRTFFFISLVVCAAFLFPSTSIAGSLRKEWKTVKKDITKCLKKHNKKIKWKKGYGKHIDKVEAQYDLVAYFEANKDDPKMLNKKKQIKKMLKKTNGNKQRACRKLLWKTADPTADAMDINEENNNRLLMIISHKHKCYKAWSKKITKPDYQVMGYVKMARRSGKICDNMK